MLYTEAEYQIYQKVRAIRAGKRRHGWVPINTRVHPDDAEKVRAMLRDLESAREAELLQAIEQDAAKAASLGVKLNEHAEAIIKMIEEAGDPHIKELRMLVQSRVANKSTARTVLARAIKRLVDSGLIVRTKHDRFQLKDHPADTQPDCGGQTSR